MKYQLKQSHLYYEGKKTDIRVEDDYFFKGSTPLNIYHEDGQIFELRPMIPFFKWPMISSSTGVFLDAEGFLSTKSKDCIFDRYLKDTSD